MTEQELYTLEPVEFPKHTFMHSIEQTKLVTIVNFSVDSTILHRYKLPRGKLLYARVMSLKITIL
jgi:hypothetical protein